MKNNRYIIQDFDAFIQATRVLVFNTFAENKDKALSIEISELHEQELSELNDILSQSECIAISKDYIRHQTNKTTKEKRVIISENDYLAMVEAFNSRMISNMLTRLVSKGIVDTAYDAEKNDFIFWLKK